MPHFARSAEMNWSMIGCATFTKSPNCASHSTSESVATVLKPYSKASTAVSESAELKISNAPFVPGKCASGAYLRPVSASLSTA